MIARSTTHVDDNDLRELLDEKLDADRETEIETHVATCDRCQRSLARLAASGPWWDETIDALGEAIETPTSITAQPMEQVDWLTPILEPASLGLGRLDRYPVAAVIGQGGMGVVLRAFDEELNRPVAVKVLSPHLAGVGAARARFMREAQAAAAIVHPSIVPIYSVVTSSRLPYLVMPLLTGGNLQQRIDREGPFELCEVLRIGIQVAEGLAAAHRLGVIHRDIKPANLLIEEGNGRILISDFGLARALDDASLTCSGMIAGTPQYMSPEQARGEPLDARSDLFSLGSVLYALATGRPPFRADNPLAVLKKITETSPQPIHQINEAMPTWLNELVKQLMEIKIGDRIPAANAAADLLRHAHAHVQNPSMNALPTSLTTKRVSWRHGIALLLGLALIGFTIPAIVLLEYENNPSDLEPVVAEGESVEAAPPYDRWIDPSLDSDLSAIDQALAKLEFELIPSEVVKGRQR